MAVNSGQEYAEEVCRQLDGKPARNLHGLLAGAWNAGAVWGAMKRLKPTPQPAQAKPYVSDEQSKGEYAAQCLPPLGSPPAQAAVPVALTDEQILSAATRLYPRWREDIQERFVLTVVRAALDEARDLLPLLNEARNAIYGHGDSSIVKNNADLLDRIAAVLTAQPTPQAQRPGQPE
jgi:hypothetical protein